MPDVATTYTRTLDQIREILTDPKKSPGQMYGEITNSLLFGRVRFLQQALIEQLGATIQSGPFQGMRFHEQAAEGCYVPKLLGCYEAELHPMIQALSGKRYQRIINIGCAEGYYAVGLARFFNSSEVLAFDTNPRAQAQCQALARLNGVGDRIRIGGLITREDWLHLLVGQCLVFCDIEGNEYDLLDPDGMQETFRASDFLIELHGSRERPTRMTDFLRAFQATHRLREIPHSGRNPNCFDALQSFKQLDQWLCIWEFRGEPTPWAFLEA